MIHHEAGNREHPRQDSKDREMPVHDPPGDTGPAALAVR